MCAPSDPPAPARSDAGPDQEQLTVRPAPPPAAFAEPPAEPEPVKLVYKDRGDEDDASPCYDLDSPRRYQLLVPIRLPFALRPDEVAPPPYYPPPGSHCDGLALHRDAHLAVLRPVLAGALRALLGPDAPVRRMVDEAVVEEHHESAWVSDRAVNFDLEAGWFRDQYGNEGRVIDAYWDFGDSVCVVQFFEFRLSWRVETDDIDPPIVTLRAWDRPDTDGQAVFDVTEAPEWLRSWYNRHIRESGDWDH